MLWHCSWGGTPQGNPGELGNDAIGSSGLTGDFEVSVILMIWIVAASLSFKVPHLRHNARAWAKIPLAPNVRAPTSFGGPKDNWMWKTSTSLAALTPTYPFNEQIAGSRWSTTQLWVRTMKEDQGLPYLPPWWGTHYCPTARQSRTHRLRL